MKYFLNYILNGSFNLKGILIEFHNERCQAVLHLNFFHIFYVITLALPEIIILRHTHMHTNQDALLAFVNV